MNNDLRNTHCARDFADWQEAYAAIELMPEYDDGKLDSLSVETLEKDILKITGGLATHMIASRWQAQLDSEAPQAQEKEVIDALPGNLRDEGLETVNIRTATGLTIPLKLRYYRRRCDKKPGKRHKGVYPVFLVLGRHERTTPLLALPCECVVSVIEFIGRSSATSSRTKYWRHSVE